MCGPYAMEAVQMGLQTAVGIGRTVSEYNQEAKNNQYRSQVAINNIKSAQNEAQNQIQLGINKSREEKISGLKKASAVLAQNASNGTDALSDSNLLNFKDVQNVSFSNAKDISDDYNLNADTYFSKANNYLQNYNQFRNTTKQNVFNNAVNVLGNYSKVASNWYSIGSKGNGNDFI